MKNKKSKVGSVPASTQIGKKGRKENEPVEFLPGNLKYMTTEIFEVWRQTGLPIRLYKNKKAEATYIIENLNDWFNLPKSLQDAYFTLYLHTVDKDKLVLLAYKEQHTL